jgi:hypothetical protein
MLAFVINPLFLLKYMDKIFSFLVNWHTKRYIAKQALEDEKYRKLNPNANVEYDDLWD